jgi:hypothetical protein
MTGSIARRSEGCPRDLGFQMDASDVFTATTVGGGG